MRQSSAFVEWWAIVEGIFYIVLWGHRKWLNSLDTLELSLRSAPMLEIRERAELWELMMADETETIAFIEGWFFGEKLDKLTRYDVMDFLTWSMFEGRNLEHLTSEESDQLEGFVRDLEYWISVEMYGVECSGDNNQAGENSDTQIKSDASKKNEEKLDILVPPSPLRQHLMQNYGAQLTPRSKQKCQRPTPKQTFTFQ